MKTSRTVSRRTALKLGAAALPLVHIRTAGAAGRLKVAFNAGLAPGADEALRKAVEQCAAQNKVAVQVDFLSPTTNQVVLTTVAEAQAKSGHDIMQGGFAGVTDYAHLREPVDNVVGRLQGRYGAFNETVEYTGKVDGHWSSVPTYFESSLFPCVARADVFKQVVGMDLQQVFPAKPDMGGFEEWTWDKFLNAGEKCAKAGVSFGLPISPCDDAKAWLGMLFRSYGAELVDAEGNVVINSDAVRTVLEYLKRLAPYLPSDVYNWDNASNNRALIAGKSALILNPPSAWAQAVKDQPHRSDHSVGISRRLLARTDAS